MPVYTLSRNSNIGRGLSRRLVTPAIPPATAGVDAVCVVRFERGDVIIDRAARSGQLRPAVDLALAEALIARRPGHGPRVRYAVLFVGDERHVVPVRGRSRALAALLETMRAHDQVVLAGETLRLVALGLL